MVQSDVWCLLNYIDGDDNGYFTYNRIQIPGIQSRIRIEYFSHEQWTMNNEKQKESNGKQKDEQNRIKVEQQNNWTTIIK